MRNWLQGHFNLSGETWLTLGAAAGMALAVSGTLSPRTGDRLPADAAAAVNGVPIFQTSHDRATEALAAGSRNPLDAAGRRLALDRLIDEELLVQRGLELDLARRDPMTRKRLATAMIEWVLANQDGAAPDEATLQAFLAEHAVLFTRTERLDVRWFHVARSEPDGAARAEQARTRLDTGAPFDEVAAAFRSASPLDLPTGPLPPAKLRDYLGARLVAEAAKLAPGTHAGPIVRTDGWHFLKLNAREDTDPPPFEQVRDQVAAEYLRRQDDEALRHYLAWLRGRARIVRPAGPAE